MKYDMEKLPLDLPVRGTFIKKKPIFEAWKKRLKRRNHIETRLVSYLKELDR